MVSICRRFPLRLPVCEQEASAGRLQVIDRPEQSGHVAGLQDQPMKAPVGFLPGMDIAGSIALPRRGVGSIEDRFRQVRGRVAKRQNFERRSHLRDLTDFLVAKARHPNASAGFADHQPLCFQPSKGLPDRYVARPELFGDVVLAKPGPGFDTTCDDAFGDRATDTGSDGIRLGHGL